MRSKFFFIALVFSLIVGATTVSAQSPDPSPTPTELKGGSTVVVSERDPETDKRIIQMRDTYRGEVEEYRRLERQYIIAKEQYNQLQTLRSLEEAVRATRAVMEQRDVVLITYLELLKLELQNTLGIDLTQKEQAIQELSTQIEAIKAHQEEVRQALDKEAIAEVTASFTELHPGVSAAGYRTHALVSLGKLQTVADRAALIRDEISQLYQTDPGVNPVQKEERDRALAETNSTLAEAGDLLKATALKIANTKNPGNSGYQQTQKDLQPIYARLSQTLEYLEELLRF